MLHSPRVVWFCHAKVSEICKAYFWLFSLLLSDVPASEGKCNLMKARVKEPDLKENCRLKAEAVEEGKKEIRHMLANVMYGENDFLLEAICKGNGSKNHLKAVSTFQCVKKISL